MNRKKEIAAYLLAAVASGAGMWCMTAANRELNVVRPMEVVENPHVTWINSRKPCQADCDNRTGLVWVYNGGKAKIRFYHNVQEGTYWATIKRPMGPKEEWIKRIVDTVEGLDHEH